MVRLGYIILNKTQLFREVLIAWNNKNNNKKTWINFQAHFCKSYSRDLKQVRALNIQQSSIANASIVEAIKEHNTQTMNQMTDQIKNSIFDTVNMMATEQESNETMSANALTIQSLQREIEELRKVVAQLTKNNAPTKGRKKPRQYCWTHGWCAHNGQECNAKADGHHDAATLENRMGGSNKNCPSKWLKDNGFHFTNFNVNKKPFNSNKKLLILRAYLSQLIQPSGNYLKPDTGASGTFIKENHQRYLQHLKRSLLGPQVHLPNNTILSQTQEGIF